MGETINCSSCPRCKDVYPAVGCGLYGSVEDAFKDMPDCRKE